MNHKSKDREKRIEGVFNQLGLGLGCDPEKIRKLLDMREEMEARADLEIIRKALKKRKKNEKKRFSGSQFKDTFEIASE